MTWPPMFFLAKRRRLKVQSQLLAMLYQLARASLILKLSPDYGMIARLLARNSCVLVASGTA